jgi:hypothetical protein
LTSRTEATEHAVDPFYDLGRQIRRLKAVQEINERVFLLSAVIPLVKSDPPA